MDTLLFSKDALKYLESLQKEHYTRIYNSIHTILENPYSHVQPLKTNRTEQPLYKLRVGHYRIILQIHSDVVIVFVISIGHRKNIYRKL